MSTMYISEYPDVGRLGGIIPVGAEPSTDQIVTFTATHGESTAFKANTSMVRVHVDGIASILFGTNPVAVANTNKRMTAGQTEYFTVPQGQGYKVSAVTST